MALVEIARFHDPQEAHIAAGALRSAGIAAQVEVSSLASVDPLMRQALGGFPLKVDTADAADATALLAELNPVNPEALEWTRHPEVLSGIPLAFTAADPGVALAVSGARSRPTPVRKAVAALGVVLMAAVIAAVVLATL